MKNTVFHMGPYGMNNILVCQPGKDMSWSWIQEYQSHEMADSAAPASSHQKQDQTESTVAVTNRAH
jgi:hypothetical protein